LDGNCDVYIDRDRQKLVSIAALLLTTAVQQCTNWMAAKRKAQMSSSQTAKGQFVSGHAQSEQNDLVMHCRQCSCVVQTGDKLQPAYVHTWSSLQSVMKGVDAAGSLRSEPSAGYRAKAERWSNEGGDRRAASINCLPKCCRRSALHPRACCCHGKACGSQLENPVEKCARNQRTKAPVTKKHSVLITASQQSD
jgi:hypothetical protein